MATTLDGLKREIAELEASDKAEILRLLIAELDEGTGEGIERAWLEEAQRRYQELESGTVKAVPARLVFERARERLRG